MMENDNEGLLGNKMVVPGGLGFVGDAAAKIALDGHGPATDVHQTAKQDPSYIPTVSQNEGMAAPISYWKDRNIRTVERPSIYAWIFCIFGLSAFFIVTCLPNVGPIPFFRAIAVFIFGSMKNVHIAFSIVITAHVSQATYAWFLARKVDPANATGWFWQTLLLAFFSLRLLLKQGRDRARLPS